MNLNLFFFTFTICKDSTFETILGMMNRKPVFWLRIIFLCNKSEDETWLTVYPTPSNTLWRKRTPSARGMIYFFFTQNHFQIFFCKNYRINIKLFQTKMILFRLYQNYSKSIRESQVLCRLLAGIWGLNEILLFSSLLQSIS